MPEIIASTIIDRFSQIVQSHPDSIAIKDEKGSYTYLELWNITENIAQKLKDFHIKPGDRIALYFDQCKEAIASLLGILKVRGVFIPLDTSDPNARLDWILSDSKPHLLLTSKNYLTSAKSLAYPSEKVIVFLEEKDGCLENNISPIDSDLAYIFYTSGSTGKPKGVCQTHQNLLHFVSVYSNYMGIKQTDRLSLLYSLNFSAANLDIFSGIYNGASVVLYNLKARGLSELSDWLKLEQITILHTIPTVFRHLLKHSRTCEQYSAIRAVDLGGEPVFKTDLTIIKRHFNDTCTVYNHLAATEASVIAYHKIDRSRDYQETYIPVGKAAPGIEISIHRQQKDSRAGRIYLKSQYLSPGYINNEELNKLVFEYQDGFTVYKSGDIGTIGHDGELIFIGRSDPRVKINGHTVDLSELEAALNSLPEINTAIIKTVGDIETQPQELICYAQLVDNNATGEIALRHHLLTLLPSYMVPKYFVFLENFPLTATGKIDRKSLTFTPPEFTTESRVTDEYNLISKLREIYSRNLKKHVENDNIAFFDYGGDSISLMDAIVEIEAIFNIKLPMGLVVKDSSVASLSKYILDHSSSGEKTSPNNEIVEPLTNIEKTKPNLFLIHGRNGHVYIGNHFLNLLDNHFNVYGFKARGLNYGENPGLSIQGIAADYICEIKKIQPSGSYYIAGLCAGGVIAVEIANQLHRTLNDVRPVLAIDPPIRKKQPPSATVFKQKLSQLYQSFHNPDERSLAVTTNNLSFRVLQERIRADFNKPDVTLMTYKVMMALEIALHTYISTPFKGEVIILASKERLEEKKEHGDTYIKGKLKHFCVSHTHNQSLDPKNYLFKSTLEKTLSYLTNQIPFT